jgi:7-cyano-7-deazaguanine reductase
MSDTSKLTQLGKSAAIPPSPQAAKLERVANPHPDALYLARFQAPEFTTLCPVTGQPDFARLVIDYAPGEWIVESKSVKLFLQSFRNHAAFHEDCTLTVAKRIVAITEPRWLRIAGFWNARGGIPIDVFWQTGEPPPGLIVPNFNDNAFTSR